MSDRTRRTWNFEEYDSGAMCDCCSTARRPYCFHVAIEKAFAAGFNAVAEDRRGNRRKGDVEE